MPKIKRQDIVPVSRSSLAQIAYNELRESIITNTVHAGDILSEQVIAQQLHTSRTPVHEALALLEQDGLVQIRRGIGALVTPITFEDIEYIQEARILLEPKAVRYALTHITREDIDELRGMLHRLQARLSNGEKISPQEFFKADFDFHNLVIARCENPYIKRFLYTINSSVRRLQVLSFNRQYSLDMP